MQNAKPASSEADLAAEQVLTDRQFRGLKAAVILMGVLLIAGFGVIVGRMVYLFQLPSVGAAATATPVERADRTLTLPTGAIVRHVSVAGDRLAVHYEAPSGSGIRVIDLATGVQQHVSVTPTAAP